MGLLQADADGPIAHSWIFLVPDAEIGGLLVAAQIQGAHHHRTGRQPFQHLLVDLELLLLSWEIRAVEVDELTAQ